MFSFDVAHFIIVFSRKSQFSEKLTKFANQPLTKQLIDPWCSIYPSNQQKAQRTNHNQTQIQPMRKNDTNIDRVDNVIWSLLRLALLPMVQEFKWWKGNNSCTGIVIRCHTTHKGKIQLWMGTIFFFKEFHPVESVSFLERRFWKVPAARGLSTQFQRIQSTFKYYYAVEQIRRVCGDT